LVVQQKFFLVPIFLTLISGCYVFDNPVDPDSDTYQGYVSPSPYAFRRRVTVSNPGAAASDYQIALVLDTLTLGAPYANMNVDGSDIRFADQTGREFPYWIESWDESGESLIWVRVALISSGTSHLYMYYGRPTAPRASNGSATFLFFDDFEDHAPGEVADSWSGGLLVADDGGHRVLDDGTGGGQAIVARHLDYGNVAVRQRWRSVSGLIDHAGLVVAYIDDTNFIYGGVATATTGAAWEITTAGGTLVQIGGDWDISPAIATGWHVQEIGLTGTAVSVRADDANLGSGTATGFLSGRSGFWSQYGQRSYRDWHLVRRYASVEPTVTLGVEEPIE
jgi:hypothetical protein